ASPSGRVIPHEVDAKPQKKLGAQPTIDTMDARDARFAKNEALFREVNERIAEVGERLQVLPDDELLEFRCECGSAECDSPVPMTRAEYEHVRSHDDRYAVVPGHEDLKIERVVECTERYFVLQEVQ